MEVHIWTKPDLKNWWGIYATKERGKAIGWIRRQTNGPGKPYMVKIYGAQFESSGIFKGSKTDVQVFPTITDAKVFVVNYFENQEVA